MTNCIEVKGLQKVFGTKTAIKNIDLQIEEGEIFGLLGPSGAGKTTMIKMLTGELNKTGGEIQVIGKQPAEFHTSEYKSQIAILCENGALYEGLNVFENLKVIAARYGVQMEKIDETLKMIDILETKKTIFKKLSKGIMQLILLDNARMLRPGLLYLDEPNSPQDPVNVM